MTALATGRRSAPPPATASTNTEYSVLSDSLLYLRMWQFNVTSLACGPIDQSATEVMTDILAFSCLNQSMRWSMT